MRVVFKAFLLVLFLLTSVSSFAVAKTEEHVQVQIRQVPATKIQRYLKDNDFVYERDYRTGTTLWERIKNWISRLLFNPVGRHTVITTWDIILYCVAAAAIFLIIYYFIKSEKVGLFTRRPKEASVGIDIIDEDIHNMDFNTLIREATEKRQYRTAVRYLYLKSLIDLSNKGLISLKAEKTNHDYLNELRSSAFVSPFKDITYLFDYAWYGNIDVNEMRYNAIKSTFDQFNQQLQNNH